MSAISISSTSSTRIARFAFRSAFFVAASLLCGANDAPLRAQNAATQNTISQNAAMQNAMANQSVVGVVRRENMAGARWVWSVERSSPRVAFSLLVRVGAGDETFATAGWRRVLAQSMLRNTVLPNPKTVSSGESTIVFQSAEARERMLETFGARLGATVNDDAIEFWATGDSAHANRVLEALLQVVRAPRLSDDDIAAACATVRAQRTATFSDVASLATEALDSQLYHDFANRPLAYGLPDVGSTGALEILTSARLRDLWKRWFQAPNFTLGTSGDLDVDRLRAQLQSQMKWFSPFSIATTASSPNTNAPLFSSVVASPPMTLTRDLRAPGDWVFQGYRVSDAAQNDLPALTVLAAALGASRLGRVPQRLLNAPNTSSTRSLDNAAQQASVVLVPRRWGGALVLFAQAQSQAQAQSLERSRALRPRASLSAEGLRDALDDEVRKVRVQLLSENEITRARRYAIGAWSAERESLRARAFRLALDEEWRSAAASRPTWMSSQNRESQRDVQSRDVQNIEYSMPLTEWSRRVQDVTAAQVQNVARRYLNVGATVFVRSRNASSDQLNSNQSNGNQSNDDESGDGESGE